MSLPKSILRLRNRDSASHFPSVRCPICDRDMGVPPHVPGLKWTPVEISLAKKMLKWMPIKSVGRFFGVGGATVSTAVGLRKPKRINLSVPSYAAMVHLVEPLETVEETHE